MLGRSLILKTSSLRPVESLVRKSFLFRPLVRRFIAGDTMEQALAASQELLDRGMRVSLDYLGENTKSEVEALAAKNTYSRMLEEIAERGYGSAEADKDAAKRPRAATIGGEPIEPLNISIKLTQCGFDLGDEFTEANYREVLQRAAANFVRVDMESSDYTDRTIQMVKRVLPQHANTGTVLQSYLRRTPADVDTMIGLGARTRLVKGAYLEPEAVAYRDKAEVDGAYLTLGKRLLDRGSFPALATHDAALVKSLNEYVAQRGIPRERFEYQMLYGIRRDLQEALHREGYNVRVYIPFGESWYPYFTRRLAERPANALFILKSLFRG